MSLAPGSRVGPYEVVVAIGAGGAGETYRARDARFGRDVAIRILSASSPDRLRRFTAEVRAVGMLNHPNVLSVFDVGTHEGAPYLVTELLVGETLGARLRRGPVPARTALEVAIQVARGLAAAHEKGVVHHALTAESVFLASCGVVKVLDFGVAGLDVPGDPSRESRDDEPAPPPEPAAASADEARPDVAALGALLLEMLTGPRALRDGRQATSPLLSDLEPGLRQCFEPPDGTGLQTARGVALALESFASRTAPDAGATWPFRGAGRAGRTGWSAVAAGLLLFCLALSPRLRPTRPAEPPRLSPVTHSGADGSAAVSPDGRSLVYVSRRDGGSRLFLQGPAPGVEVPLTSGPGDTAPRFFPDGGSVLFTRTDAAGHASLEKVSVLGGGGEVRRLVEDAADGDVSPDGRSLAFVRRLPEGTRFQLGLAPVSGGAVRPLALFGSYVHAPRFSPDGETIAVSEIGGPQSSIPGAIVLVHRDGRVERLPSPTPFRGLTSAAWNGDGRSLLFGVLDAGLVHATSPGGRLYRQALDGGRPEALQWWPNLGPGLEVAGDGRLLLDSVSVRENLRLVELGGSGSPPRWLTRGTGSSRQPAFSPDGEWILFSSDWSGNLDLWLLSTRSGALRRVTDDPADDWDPAFSPDGRRILWSSNRTGHFEVWSAALDGGDARRLTDDGADAENPAPTPDGKWIVYGSFGPTTQGLWKVPADGSRAKAALLVTGSLHQVPEVSPDGRYVLCRHGILRGPRSVKVFSLATGTLAGEIAFDVGDAAGSESGRARWLPDGRIAFLGLDAHAVSGVYVQDFVEGRDTTSTRRRLAGFDPGAQAQSFGISPDGSSVVLSEREVLAHVLEARPVANVSGRRRRTP